MKNIETIFSTMGGERIIQLIPVQDTTHTEKREFYIVTEHRVYLYTTDNYKE